MKILSRLQNLNPYSRLKMKDQYIQYLTDRIEELETEVMLLATENNRLATENNRLASTALPAFPRCRVAYARNADAVGIISDVTSMVSLGRIPVRGGHLLG